MRLLFGLLATVCLLGAGPVPPAMQIRHVIFIRTLPLLVDFVDRANGRGKFTGTAPVTITNASSAKSAADDWTASGQ
jgi:hypothetical protein